MIFDHISNLGQYAFLGKNFAAAAKFAAENDLNALSPGRHEIDGERLYINVLERELTTTPETWEVHRRYADIQLLLSGSEKIGVCPLSRIQESADFDEQNDCALFKGQDGELVALRPGEFVLVLPQDVHLPNCQGNNGSYSKKAIFKVLLDKE